MDAKMMVRRQELLNKFLEENGKGLPVVVVGHSLVGEDALHIPTSKKILLSTGPALSAWRAYRRDTVNKGPGFRDTRTLANLPLKKRRGGGKKKKQHLLPAATTHLHDRRPPQH